jgi:hypothetical protein
LDKAASAAACRLSPDLIVASSNGELMLLFLPVIVVPQVQSLPQSRLHMKVLIECVQHCKPSSVTSPRMNFLETSSGRKEATKSAAAMARFCHVHTGHPFYLTLATASQLQEQAGTTGQEISSKDTAFWKHVSLQVWVTLILFIRRVPVPTCSDLQLFEPPKPAAESEEYK